MVKVYLAGRVWETDYRKHVHKHYGKKLKIVDPMIENGAFVDLEHKKVIHNGSIDDVVENDKALIDTCDILVAIVNEYSAGTMMEILYAYNRNIPVYLIVGYSQNFENDIWLKYHSTKIFDSTYKCYGHILKQIK